MMDETYCDIFHYKCSTEESDGWPFRSLCGPTGKFNALQEASEQRERRKYDSSFSRGPKTHTYKYMVKQIEQTKFGWRMVIPKKMLGEAVANVTRRYPHLIEKVKPEFAQFIHIEQEQTNPNLQFA